jgi:hypothetical protein
MTEGPAGAEFLCGGWKWDPAMRELRHYPRRGRRGFAAEPDAVEQLQPARTLTVHRWSQPPMQTSTGEMTSPRHARILLKYEDGRELEINEDDRVCAEKLVATLAEACGLEPAWLGAPGGWHRGILPERDDMGRLTYKGRGVETVLDEAAGILTVTRKGRLFSKKRRELRISEIRALDLEEKLDGGSEVFTVYALLYPEDERVPVAAYRGMEGWADAGEWREFARDLGRSLGVEARANGAVLE